MTKYIQKLCERVKVASRELALIDSKTKDRALAAMSRTLLKNTARIIAENKKDVISAERKGLSCALIDRLTLNESRISDMAGSLFAIAKLKDPVGEVIETIKRPNGLLIKKVRVPIGVILIIYESRPNVTSDCIGLCIKSSNAVILRGASDAINSNAAIFDILNKEALKFGLPKNSIAIIRDTDRMIVDSLLTQAGLIDLVIPRGGESLAREVTEKSRIPVIKHYKGVCHTYVDESADLKMAERICFNAKVQRPGVCNAMETMLVNRRIADKFLPGMIRRFKDAGVEIRGCKETVRLVHGVKPAKESDWYAEYLDLILSVKVVKDTATAIRHIMKYGSYH
ncbi:MAG: glutamate-5-semialdehyde dehydrogenase, partial [Candidatus Omnitrophica bacterium]|nr:glutamate-5-semialdehyde dehydrogenase [Candidatus Omnitrophota bacterium]